MDPDLSEIVTSLLMVPALRKLAISRNNIGERTLEALEKLLMKRQPNNLDELTIEGI